MINNQAVLFCIFIIDGLIIGLLFDFFRILRKSFKTKDIITYIEDILFWILTGIILLYSIFTFNNGEIRFYMFLGAIIGCFIYMLLFSRYIVNTITKLVIFLKKIITKIISIIIYPLKVLIKILNKILKKPISFITINIRKNHLIKQNKNYKIYEKFIIIHLYI